MDNFTYQNALKETIQNLEEIQHSLMGNITNLAFSGEYQQLDEVFEIGDIVNFSPEDFRNCEDPRVQVLLALRKEVDEVLMKLSVLG